MPVVEEKPLVCVKYKLDKFMKDWRHCDEASNYLAQLVSSFTNNPSYLSNMLSTVVNEFLETIFHLKERREYLIVEVLKLSDVVIIDFQLTLSEGNSKLFDSFFETISHSSSKDVYLTELMRIKNGEKAHRFIGLYEILSDYNIQLSRKIMSEKNHLRFQLDV